MNGEVGELSVKRGDVGGKEEVVERSEEVECKGEFLVVCVGELRVMRGDLMGGEVMVERLEESADSVGETKGGGGREVVWNVGKSEKSEKENRETFVLEGFGVVSASVWREKGEGVWWKSGPGGWCCWATFPGGLICENFLCALCRCVHSYPEGRRAGGPASPS